MGKVMLSFFSGIRARLVVLVLLAIIPALGLILYTAWEQRKHAELDAQETTLKLARQALNEHRRLINNGRQVLSQLAQHPEVKRPRPKSCSDFLASKLEEYAEYSNLGVIRLDGNLICSALSFEGFVNLSDREYFLLTVRKESFSVGEYQIGRVTGKATLNFGYPILDDAGQLMSVVFAALDLAWLNSLIKDSPLPEGSVLNLIDAKGTLLAHYPEPQKWIGKSMSEQPLIRRLLSVQGEETSHETGLDGVSRIYAFTTVRVASETRAYLGVGIPTKVAFADARQAFRRNLIFLGIVSLLALTAAWFGGDLFVLRRVNALVEVTKRLGSGDLSARTGLPYGTSELSQLARTFDEMASSLETQQTELKQARDETQRNLDRIRALHEIDLAITSTLDLKSVLGVLLEQIDLVLPHVATTVRLSNPENAFLEPVACRNLDDKEWKAEAWRQGRGLANVVFETTSAIIIRDVQTDPRVRDTEFYRKHKLVSYLGVPLVAKEKTLGVLGFYTKEEHEFTGDEIESLQTLAGQAAIAIHNSQLYEQTRKQAEELQKKAEELERSNKVKDEFLSVMSHELRTPLNVVLGYTGMIQDGMLGEVNPNQQDACAKILNRTNDLLSMVNSILFTTSLESKAVKAEQHPVNLTHLLGELKSAYDTSLAKDVALVWNYSPDLPSVVTDGVKLKHIFQNLINNAVKFTDKGSVTISARMVEASRQQAIDPSLVPLASRLSGGSRLSPHASKWVEFQVADTGIGISKEMQSVIFDKFKQVDSSETRLYGGVGLGLYIAKQFTEMLGGTVGVESEPGKGSTFKVRIPTS